MNVWWIKFCLSFHASLHIYRSQTSLKTVSGWYFLKERKEFRTEKQGYLLSEKYTFCYINVFQIIQNYIMQSRKLIIEFSNISYNMMLQSHLNSSFNVSAIRIIKPCRINQQFYRNIYYCKCFHLYNTFWANLFIPTWQQTKALLIWFTTFFMYTRMVFKTHIYVDIIGKLN